MRERGRAVSSLSGQRAWEDLRENSTSQGCDGIDLSKMASSVGVGLTWYSPLGPLSFNLALPVRTPEDADKQVFQFSLGQTF